MNSKLEALFDEPEKRYLNADELSALSQYVSSVPERLSIYRQLRDQEVEILQPVVNTIQQQMPEVAESTLERSIQNIMLILRYAAMAMLIDDVDFMDKRLYGWLPEMVKAFGTHTLNQKLFELLNQKLAQTLSPQHLNLLKPNLDRAQTLMMSPRETVNSVSAPLAGIL
ncbi:hypothetical protein C7271_01400 [filamentous cyanobacterium CCP5]|nr:hypothetical protein C7271_01400 [filamentous cyanobacterium CCP5]